MLAELLADPFFSAAPPKSTGRERFGDAYAARAARAGTRRRRRRHRGRAHRAQRRDGRRATGRPRGTEVVASGGGCHHPGLMAALERRARGRGAATRSAASTSSSSRATPRRRSPSRCWAILRCTGSPATFPPPPAHAAPASLARSRLHDYCVRRARLRPAHSPRTARRRRRRLRTRGRPHRRRARSRRRRLHRLRRHRRIGAPPHGRTSSAAPDGRCSSRRTWSAGRGSRWPD